jgi:hypothetical protein
MLFFGSLMRRFGGGQPLLERSAPGRFLQQRGVELRLALRGLLSGRLSIGRGLLLGSLQGSGAIDELGLQRIVRGCGLRKARVGLSLLLGESRGRALDLRRLSFFGAQEREPGIGHLLLEALAVRKFPGKRSLDWGSLCEEFGFALREMRSGCGRISGAVLAILLDRGQRIVQALLERLGR